MINFLKTYLVDNYFDGLRQDDINIVKTQNGTGHLNKKIVFYVFDKNNKKPALVVYAARNKKVNDVLKNSINSNKKQDDLAPKILFEDYYNNIYFVGIEFIQGQKLNLNNKDDINLVFDYIIRQYKDNKNNEIKRLDVFYQDIKNKFFKIDIDINNLIEDKFSSFKDVKLPVIKQHGDLQDNNIFIVNGKLKIIDWDDYGFCDFPLFDFFTIYIKYKRKIAKDNFIENKLNDFYKLKNFEKINTEIYIIFYYLYDFLRKDKLHNKYERKKHYLELEKNIKKI
ncbi:MAG: hypothetical protein WCS88_00315 [Patescibacteria group bacterium]|jgi:hypothetical protein